MHWPILPHIGFETRNGLSSMQIGIIALVDVEAHPRDLRRKRRGMHPKGFNELLARRTKKLRVESV